MNGRFSQPKGRFQHVGITVEPSTDPRGNQNVMVKIHNVNGYFYMLDLPQETAIQLCNQITDTLEIFNEKEENHPSPND
ncbi:hypothetical protein ACXZ66_01990 [Corynebacterium sp. S7]